MEQKDKIPGTIIFKAIVGSQAYGTNVEGSDIDIKGVYIQSVYDASSFNYVPQVEVNKDEVYYEIKRFIELLGSANPTVLELLYTPEDCVLYKHHIWEKLESFKEQFLTKECKNSFGGYARQQIKKASGLDKKMNWEKETMTRKTPLDFCYINLGAGASMPLASYLQNETNANPDFCGLVNIANFKDCYALYWDKPGQFGQNTPIGLRGITTESSNALRLSSIPKDIPVIQLGTIYYSKDSYTQHCNKWKEYQTWLKERNVQRYVDINEHGQSYDGKNLLHCMRLIMTARDIARSGTIAVRRSESEREYLLSIRRGKVDLKEILELAEAEIQGMDKIFNESSLPDKVSKEFQQKVLNILRLMSVYELNELLEIDF